MSTKVLEIELTEKITPIEVVKEYKNYHVLIRAQQKPIGWVSFWKVTNQTHVTVEEIYTALKAQLNIDIIPYALQKHLGLATGVTLPEFPISVIICTRNRTENLQRCLESFSRVQYNQYEVIVVDNAPGNDDSYHLTKKFPVRYVREDRPGLDWARNRGIMEARYPIVAFTDDDVVVDQYWLQAISKAFAGPEIMAVTGFVAPYELITNAQHIFEFGYGGMGHGFRRRIFRKKDITERQLIRSSNCGVGANMAFRKQVFDEIGMFDIALDVGTPSHGGGDIELFHRLIKNNYTLLYEPSVLVWHTHRRQLPALRKQVFDNGRSFGCYLLTCLRNRTVSRSSIMKFLLLDWLKNWIIPNVLRPRKRLPRNLAFFEVSGMLTSPFAYTASRNAAKQIANGRSNPQFQRPQS